MFSFHVLGGAYLSSESGPITGPATQRLRLAVLALLACASQRGVTRDKLIGYLWPDLDTDTARSRLADALHGLRRTLGKSAILSAGDDLRLNVDIVHTDVGEFESALATGDHARAAQLYVGPFLDGFFIAHAAEFEHWVEDERQRLASLYARALEALAEAQEAAGDTRGAVEWWRKLAAHDPYSSRVTLQLIHALHRSGDPGAALRQAQAHQTLLREELGVDATAEITTFIDRLKHGSAGDASIAGGQPVGGHSRAAAAPVEPPSAPSETARQESSLPEPGPPDVQRRRAAGIALAGTLAVVSIGVIGWFGIGWREAPPPLDPDAIMVAPFRTAPDASLHDLGREIAGLLVTGLSGETGSRAVDPGATLAAWSAAAEKSGTELKLARAGAVARGLGAGKLLMGAVIGTPEQLILDATLYDAAPTAARVRVSARGHADSLPVLVDRLVGELLAWEAGVPLDQLETLASTSLPVVRTYLEAVRSYRAGQPGRSAQLLFEAAQGDSTLGLIAIQLALLEEWGPLVVWPGTVFYVTRNAWPARDRLSRQDGMLFDAIGGHRLPKPRPHHERYAALVYALNLSPDRLEALYLMGRFELDLVLRGDEEALARSSRFFRRVLELDPAYAPARFHVVREAAAAHDSAAVVRLVDEYLETQPAGEMASFFEWIRAAMGGDARALLDVRARMPKMPRITLAWIADVAARWGIDIEGGEAALDALRASAHADYERTHYHGRNLRYMFDRGRVRDAMRTIDSLAQQWVRLGPIEGLEVTGTKHAQALLAMNRLAAVVWGADTVGLGAAVLVEEGIYQGDWAPELSVRALELIEMTACAAGIGRLAMGQADAARPAVTALRALLERDIMLPDRNADAACAATLEALIAVAGKQTDAQTLLERADSVLRSDPPLVSSRSLLQLVLARAFEAMGDPVTALRIIRRRHPHETVDYLATFLREEGRLAARAGDRDGAIRAWRHYLLLRTDPDPELIPEVERARAALNELLAG